MASQQTLSSTSSKASDGTQRPVAIVGVPAADPARPPVRMEFRDMIKQNPKQWALYLLGLEKFKGTDENLPLSFFQIAGIHGLPNTYWPNKIWNNDMLQVNKGGIRKGIPQWGGFCTHSSILFLSWHRPYLALFEAELYKHVNEIARGYEKAKDGKAWLAAAESFRMPYWDWALPVKDNTDAFPKEVLSGANLAVEGKKFDGNPLAGYKFKDVGKNYPDINKFPSANATLRYPNNGKQSLDSDENKLKAEWGQYATTREGATRFKKGKNLTERTLYVLQSYKSFNSISNNAFFEEQGSENWGSFEDIHNAIHDYVGGSGHMSNPKYAAFDPIFWLHHTNIDRLCAIWQALNDDDPDATPYVETQTASWGTFTTKQGDDEDINTPLTPFTKSEKKGDFWNSKDVRSTKKFGYVYPETKDWDMSPADVRQKLYEIYSTGSAARMMRTVASAPQAPTEDLKLRAESHVLVAKTSLNTETLVQAAQAKDGKLPESIAAEAAHLTLPKNRSPQDLVSNHRYLEWLVNVKAEKHALGGNFAVHVFLGAPEDDHPDLYVANPTHVGLFSTFGSEEDTACEKCQADRADGLQVTGQIPLTVALVERYLAGHVDGLTVDAVVPFLREHLHWRVTSLEGERQRRGDVNKLLVSVVTNEVTLPEDPAGFPRYATTVVRRPEVTTNRDGEGRGRGTGYTGGDITLA